MRKIIPLFFNILYAVALITCFIINLAVAGTLSWFFIVLAALLIPFTITSLFPYIKKHQFLIISFSFLGSILVLLGVINIYTNGNWFLITVAPILLGYLIIFIPIYLILYDVPQVMKRHIAAICLLIDLIGLMIMLFVINLITNGDWLLTTAYPIVFFSAFLPLLLIIIIRYVKINWSFKVSQSFIICAIYTSTTNLFIAKILNEDINYKFDFSNWSPEYVSGNVNMIISLSFVFLAIIYGIVGSIINKRR